MQSSLEWSFEHLILLLVYRHDIYYCHSSPEEAYVGNSSRKSFKDERISPRLFEGLLSLAENEYLLKGPPSAMMLVFSSYAGLVFYNVFTRQSEYYSVDAT
jgi:hypothetical protein